jgi:hypothetical protein
MEAGGLDGMQTFDQELEKLIVAGTIERELGLSFATNRTNLQLRLDTQGEGAAEAEAIPLRPDAGDRRRAAGFRAGGGDPDLDDLIER